MFCAVLSQCAMVGRVGEPDDRIYNRFSQAAARINLHQFRTVKVCVFVCLCSSDREFQIIISFLYFFNIVINISWCVVALNSSAHFGKSDRFGWSAYFSLWERVIPHGLAERSRRASKVSGFERVSIFENTVWIHRSSGPLQQPSRIFRSLNFKPNSKRALERCW